MEIDENRDSWIIKTPTTSRRRFDEHSWNFIVHNIESFTTAVDVHNYEISQIFVDTKSITVYINTRNP